MAKYVPFYESFWSASKRLTDEERLRLYDAVLLYGFRGDYPDFSAEEDASLDLAFQLIAPNIDAFARNWENGRKGGRPRKAKASEDGEQE